MDVPASLQRYADLVVKGKYNDVHKLWSSLQASDKAAATKLSKLGVASKLDQTLVTAVAAAHDRTRKKSANNRGHRSLTSKPAPRPQRLAKGEPALADMRMVDEDIFIMDDGRVAPTFDIDDITINTEGVCFPSASKASVVLLEHIGERCNGHCAIVTKKLAFDNCSSKHRQMLLDEYQPAEVTLYFMESKAAPKPYKCLVFQVGEQHLNIKDSEQDEIVTIVSAAPRSIKVSI
jgi:hypothetical protein